MNMRVLNPFVVISTFILCSTSITQTASNFLQLNTNRVSIHEYDDYWILSLPCISQTPTCSIEFILIPFGWIKQTQQLKIPFRHLEQDHEYEVMAMVADSEGNKKELSIFTTKKETLIEVKAKYRFAPGDDFDVAVLNLQRQQQTKPEKNYVFLPKDDSELSWLEKNGIAHYIPTIGKIDRLIASADTYQMSKAFQNILSDKSSCDQKINYLNELNDRVDKHIIYSKNALQSEEQKMKNAEEKIDRLTKQQISMKNQLEQASKMSRKVLRNQEIELQRKKVVYFSKHYSLSIVANKYLQKLNSFIASSGVNSTELQQIKEEIKEDQKQLKEINKKIEELLELKNILDRKIEANKKKVSDTGNVGYISASKIAALQQKYKEYNDLSISYEAKSKKVQEQLQKIKEKLQKAQDNTSYLQQRLENTEKELRENKRILESQQVEKLKETIKVLERNQPRLEEKTERCSSEVELKEQQKRKAQQAFDKQLVFTSQAPEKLKVVSRIPPKTFFAHLQNNLQKVNIFSSEWILKYGVPSTSLFSCKSSEKKDAGYGVIIAMDKGQIRIQQENGRVMALYLGVCTSINGIRKTFVPIPGDIIEWEGQKVVTGIVNVHRANIYRV